MYSDSERGGEQHGGRDMSFLHENSTQISQTAAGVIPPAYIIPVVVVVLMLLYVLFVYVRCYFVSERRIPHRDSFSPERDLDYYRLSLPDREKVPDPQHDKKPVVMEPSRARSRRQIIDATQQETRRID